MNRLVKYLGVILKWRKLLLWNVVAVTVAAVGVSLVLPQRFAATAQILPPGGEGDALGISGILGGSVGSSLSKLKSGMLGASGPSDLMVGILASRSVVQSVAERCSVAKYYRIRSTRMDAVVKQLRSMTRTGSGDDGIVRITVEAKTRQLAADLANTYVAALDSVLRYSNISRGRNMRVFVEHRLAQVESSLALAGDSLRLFQQANRVASVDDETKAAVDAYAELESQMIAREAALAALAGVAGPENPVVSNMRNEVLAFRSQLQKLERGDAQSGFGVGFGVSFQALPPVAAAFARRYLDYKIQQEAYATLYQQYEYASILEARDAPALTVLDRAVPPDRRSFPPRAKIILGAILFGIIAGCFFAFASEYFLALSDSRPDEYRAWTDLFSWASPIGRRLRSLRPTRDAPDAP